MILDWGKIMNITANLASIFTLVSMVLYFWKSHSDLNNKNTQLLHEFAAGHADLLLNRAEALNTIKNVLNGFIKLDNTLGMAVARIALGNCYENKLLFEQAKFNYKKSLDDLLEFKRVRRFPYCLKKPYFFRPKVSKEDIVNSVPLLDQYVQYKINLMDYKLGREKRDEEGLVNLFNWNESCQTVFSRFCAARLNREHGDALENVSKLHSRVDDLYIKVGEILDDVDMLLKDDAKNQALPYGFTSDVVKMLVRVERQLLTLSVVDHGVSCENYDGLDDVLTRLEVEAKRHDDGFCLPKIQISQGFLANAQYGKKGLGNEAKTKLREQIKQNVEKALFYLDERHNLAVDLKDEAKAFRLNGYYLKKVKDYRAAKASFERALLTAKVIEDKMEIMCSKQELANMEFDSAKILHKDIQELPNGFLKYVSIPIPGCKKSCIEYFNDMDARYKRARTLYEECLDIAKEYPDYDAMRQMNWACGDICYGLGLLKTHLARASDLYKAPPVDETIEDGILRGVPQSLIDEALVDFVRSSQHYVETKCLIEKHPEIYTIEVTASHCSDLDELVAKNERIINRLQASDATQMVIKDFFDPGAAEEHVDQV